MICSPDGSSGTGPLPHPATHRLLSLWVAGPFGENVPQTFSFSSDGSGPVPRKVQPLLRRTMQK